MKTRTKPMLIEKTTTWIGSVPSLLLHTLIFIGAFALGIAHLASWEIVLLVLTTVVSLEAIYLAIFIQMTVNRNTQQLREVEEDIDEIQEDVEGLGEDVDEIQEDIEEMSEDLEEMTEEEQAQMQSKRNAATLEQLTSDVRRVLEDLEALKKKQ